MMIDRKYLKFLFAAGIALLSLNMQSQGLQTIDEVTTKSGSVWKGTITEITDDGYYIIETVSGLTLRLHESTIENVYQDWVGGRSGHAKRQYSFKEKGFYQTVEVSLLANSDAGGVSATYSAGHRFSRWLGVGAGTGITGINLGWGQNIIPLFVEARGFFLKKKVTPYYAVRFGYGFALTNFGYDITEATGGYLFNPELGLRFGGGRTVSFYTGVGLHIQKATFTSGGVFRQEIFVENYKYKRLEFKFGLTF